MLLTLDEYKAHKEATRHPGPTDSTGIPIYVGNKVQFRGHVYTIRDFIPGQGRFETNSIKFLEKQHTVEIADEVSVDLINSFNAHTKPEASDD